MKRLMTLLVGTVILSLIASYSRAAGTWTKIWGPVGTVVEDSSHRLFATKLPEGDIYQFKRIWDEDNNVSVIKWEKVGGPGKKFVAVRNQLYALTPGGGVRLYSGNVGDWIFVSVPEKMGNIYGGPTGLFATAAQTGDIYAYNNFLEGKLKQGWIKIGGPGKMFAVGGEKGEFATAIRYLYGIEPDAVGNKVRQFNFKAKNWDNIIGTNPAVSIYAGGEKLYATNPSGKIYEYNHKSSKWTQIGYPAKMFTVDKETGTIYGLATDGSHVNKYTGTGWITIRQAATGSIFAGPRGRLYATDAVTKDLWAYTDNPF